MSLYVDINRWMHATHTLYIFTSLRADFVDQSNKVKTRKQHIITTATGVAFINISSCHSHDRDHTLPLLYHSKLCLYGESMCLCCAVHAVEEKKGRSD